MGLSNTYYNYLTIKVLPVPLLGFYPLNYTHLHECSYLLYGCSRWPRARRGPHVSDQHQEDLLPQRGAPEHEASRVARPLRSRAISATACGYITVFLFGVSDSVVLASVPLVCVCRSAQIRHASLMNELHNEAARLVEWSA